MLLPKQAKVERRAFSSVIVSHQKCYCRKRIINEFKTEFWMVTRKMQFLAILAFTYGLVVVRTDGKSVGIASKHFLYRF